MPSTLCTSGLFLVLITVQNPSIKTCTTVKMVKSRWVMRMYLLEKPQMTRKMLEKRRIIFKVSQQITTMEPLKKSITKTTGKQLNFVPISFLIIFCQVCCDCNVFPYEKFYSRALSDIWQDPVICIRVRNLLKDLQLLIETFVSVQ